MPADQPYHVDWLRLALRDMREIAAYIAQDSPEAAKAIVDDDHNIDSPSWTDNYEIAHGYALMHALNSSRGTPVIYSVQVAACHVLCFLKDIPDREFLLDLNTAGFGQLYETLDINDDFLVFGSKS